MTTRRLAIALLAHVERRDRQAAWLLLAGLDADMLRRVLFVQTEHVAAVGEALGAAFVPLADPSEVRQGITLALERRALQLAAEEAELP